MEILVTEATGLPSRAVISIGAGGARRQAPWPLREPFRFPHTPQGAGHVKVDILSSLTGANLDLDACCKGGAQPHVVLLPMPDGSKATVKLLVKEEASLCGKRSDELKRMDNLRRCDRDAATVTQQEMKSASEARSYAEAHDLGATIHEMFQRMLRDQPLLPYTFMASFLGDKAVEHKELAPAVPVVGPLRSVGASAQPVQKSAPPPLPRRLPTHPEGTLPRQKFVVAQSSLACPQQAQSVDRKVGQQLSCAASCPPSTIRPQQQGRVVAAEMCPPFQQQHFSSEREMRNVSGPSSSPKSTPRVWPTQRSISQPPPSQHHMPWLQDTRDAYVRMHLVKEHMQLRSERAALMTELAQLEVAALISQTDRL